MKKVFLIFSMLVWTMGVKAQDCSELKNDPDVRSEIQDLANQAASNLMSCCSKWGGNNLKAQVYWDADDNGTCQTRISKLTGNITITMLVSWTGSLSGTYYWIKGRLVFNTSSKTRSWEKLSDSGGFSPGCSNGCIN